MAGRRGVIYPLIGTSQITAMLITPRAAYSGSPSMIPVLGCLMFKQNRQFNWTMHFLKTISALQKTCWRIDYAPTRP